MKVLTKRPTENQLSSDMTDMLTLKEAAKFLRLSLGTLYIWVERHKIPFVRLPGSNRIRLRRADLQAFIERGVVPADGAK